MGVELASVIMVAVDALGFIDTEEDSFYDDLDKYSTFKEGNISYLNDGMCGNYLYIGECLKYEDDVYNGGAFELDVDDIENIKIRVWEFIKDKYNISVIPKVVIVNHVY